MENNHSAQSNQALVLPAFGKAPELKLEMGPIREAESRFLEAKTVNPATYSDLEHTFNESYRDLKRHLSNIGYQLTLADKELRAASAEVMQGTYEEYLKGKARSYDTSRRQDAFLMKDATYVAALDRVNQLKALESNFEGKMKVIENVCRYMRQKMYLISKSGVPMGDIGVTIGKK